MDLGDGQRGKFTLDAEGKLIPYVKQRTENRSAYVITDEIPGGLMSHADGKMYTSKSALRKSYRALGFVEVGNETPMQPYEDPYSTPEYQKQLEDDVGRAYNDVQWGNAPLSEWDKHRCEIINKQVENKLENETLRPVDEFGRPIE